MKKLVLIAALGTGLLATGAMAHWNGGDVPEGMIPTFEDLDTDGDGQLSLEELQSMPAARFAAIDTNGDGVLSPEEIIAAGQARMAERMGEHFSEMIAHWDTNGDGMLQPDELASRNGDRLFDRVDGDDSGAISPEEFEAAKSRLGNRQGGGNHGMGGGGLFNR